MNQKEFSIDIRFDGKVSVKVNNDVMLDLLEEYFTERPQFGVNRIGVNAVYTLIKTTATNYAESN